MSAEPRKIRRQAARRPAARTVTATIASGDFEGWSATARADFPAKLVIELDSGNIGRILAALEVIIVDHNLPNVDDEIAESLADVDPYAGLIAIANEISGELAKLPPR